MLSSRFAVTRIVQGLVTLHGTETPRWFLYIVDQRWLYSWLNALYCRPQILEPPVQVQKTLDVHGTYDALPKL